MHYMLMHNLLQMFADWWATLMFIVQCVCVGLYNMHMLACHHLLNILIHA